MVFQRLINTYYGLETGRSDHISMVSALLGYIAFKLVSTRLNYPSTSAEIVLVQTVATSTGYMPVTAGFTETFPPLE